MGEKAGSAMRYCYAAKIATRRIACEELGIFSADWVVAQPWRRDGKLGYCLDCVWPLCGLGG